MATTLDRPLPTHPRDLSPELLTRFIGRMHPGVEVASVEVIEALGVGGMVSTAGRGKLRLRYARGGEGLPENLPENLIVKMTIDEKGVVPTCLYETEVRMHQRMLPGLPLERALCLGAEYDDDTRDFVLLLEDLTDRGARFTNVLEPSYSPDDVATLLDELAKLHAHYWLKPALDREDWLTSYVAGPYFELCAGGRIVGVLAGNAASSPYRQDFVTRIGSNPQRMWDMVDAMQKHQAATMPFTLCHGDAGAHNSYRLPNGKAGWVDWQMSVKAPWTRDVHYLMVTGLSVADRRKNERALIAHYIDRLRAHGVREVPTLDAAMEAYTLAMVWALVIGWFCVRPDYYSPMIVCANLERILAAVNDHDTLARVEKLL